MEADQGGQTIRQRKWSNGYRPCQKSVISLIWFLGVQSCGAPTTVRAADRRRVRCKSDVEHLSIYAVEQG